MRDGPPLMLLRVSVPRPRGLDTARTTSQNAGSSDARPGEITSAGQAPHAETGNSRRVRLPSLSNALVVSTGSIAGGTRKTGGLQSANDLQQRYHADMDERVEPLPTGAAVPDFTLPQSTQLRASLKSVRGRPVVLVFYPLDWEPVSLQQLALYQDYLVEFERLGAYLMGISGDHVFSHAALARHLRLGFPLLSDWRPKGAVARMYGIYRESQELSARALFVVDSSGVIRFSQTYPDSVNPGVNDILTTLETLGAEDKALEEGLRLANGVEPHADEDGLEPPRDGPKRGASGNARATVHDLRQDLMIARGYAQLLARYAERQEGLDNEQIRKALERIDTSTARIAALLDQTLTARDPSRR